jgi:hypothetical protein
MVERDHQTGVDTFDRSGFHGKVKGFGTLQPFLCLEWFIYSHISIISEMSGNDHKQSPDEIMSQLTEQIGFLVSSSKSFDKGNEAEAKRLATHLRTLLFDSKYCRSLLGQLTKKDKIQFYDTAYKYDPNNLVTSCCLCIQAVHKGGWYYVPRNLGNTSKYQKKVFNDWWKNQVVIADKHHTRFKRRDLVLFVADKDGGCHVDPELDKEYAELSRFNSLGWEPKPQNRVELACIRQIAHEVLKSLSDKFPELLIEVPECSIDDSTAAMMGHSQQKMS